MKRLKEMTREELVALTEDEVKDLIDLECMYEGKPVLCEEPKYTEFEEVPEPDVIVYSILGENFTNKEEVQAFKTLYDKSKSLVSLSYFSNDYNNRYIKNDSLFNSHATVEERNVYSFETYEKIKETIHKNDKIKRDNEEAKEIYNSIISERQEIVDLVEEKINEAIKETNNISRAIVVYKKYLKLSDNNETIAMNFFKDSEYSNYTEQVKESLKSEEK